MGKVLDRSGADQPTAQLRSDSSTGALSFG
jgi:hypothetical protein